MKEIDFLIVGQGLAGTLLAHFLLEAGQRVLVVDNHHQGAASKVAAGIINPITGRRYVKSWRIEEVLPFAKQTYTALEQQLNISIYHELPILRALFNQREENDWLHRSDDPAYKKYVLDNVSLGAYAENTVPAFSYGELIHTAQVDVPLLVETYRKFLRDKNSLLEEKFALKQLDVTASPVTYKDIRTEKVIFCEGHQASTNPFFNYLPYNGAKGEVLLIRIPGVSFQKMLKHRIFIVPLPNELYWVGSTNDWNYEDDKPSESGRTFLLQRLQDILTVPFEVVAHQAAIRPTVKDRRPFLGLHPEFSQLAIFNGLGTKGASLGPFFAKQMADFLVGSGKLDAEADIRRFLHVFTTETQKARST